MTSLRLENGFSQLRFSVVHANIQYAVVHSSIDALCLNKAVVCNFCKVESGENALALDDKKTMRSV